MATIAPFLAKTLTATNVARALHCRLLASPATQARTSMAQTRAFAIIGPALWNQLPPSTRSSLLTGEPSASFRSLLSSLCASCTGRASDWSALQEVLCKCIDTRQHLNLIIRSQAGIQPGIIHVL